VRYLQKVRTFSKQRKAPKSKRKVPITQLTSVDDIPTLSVFWPEEQEGDASEIDRGHVAPGGSELGDEWKALAELQTLISPLDTMDSNVGMASDVVADVRKEVETQSHEGILRLLRKTLEEVEGVLTHRDDRMKLLKGIECQLRNDKESWEVNQKGLEDLQQKLQNKRICL